MNKEKIFKLMTSDKKQEAISVKLIKWIKNDPTLLNLSFTNNCNIFHMLVLNNKAQVIKDLLEAESISHSDLLLKLLNAQNKLGNTPLHEAVIVEQIESVLCLLKSGKVNIELRNNESKTVLDLAGDNIEFRRALIGIELEKIKHLNLLYRDEVSESISLAKLQDAFPLLSSKREMSKSSSHAAKGPFSRLFSWQSEVRSTKADSEEKKVVPLSSEEDFEFLLAKLLINFKTNSEQYHSIKEQFYFLCQKIDLADQGNLKQLLVRFKGNEELIDSLLVGFKPFIEKQYNNLQKQAEKILEKRALQLIKTKIRGEASPLKMPAFDEVSVKEADILRAIWLLTAGQTLPEGEREIDLQQIINTALGMQSIISFEQLLTGLIRLYPKFDRQQKLVANYIVCQLTIYDGLDRLSSADSARIDLLVKHFAKSQSEKKPQGLGKFGEKLAGQLTHLVKLHQSFHQPMLKNYRLLNLAYKNICANQNLESFDKLVDCALAKKSSEREAEVASVAREFRTLTTAFYQTTSMSEFYKGNWSKDSARSLAPNIKNQTDYFDQLINYFVGKILNQSPENLVNGLRFLMQIGQELCPLKGESYPDLNALMLIVGVLNNRNLSRLTDSFAALSSKDRDIIAELDKIVSNERNCKWMREVYRADRTSLPFLGAIQTDLTFAKDGNPTLLSQSEAIGKILLDIFKVKARVSFNLTNQFTTLPEFLHAYPEVDEDELYYKSLRFQPVETDGFDLSNPEHDLISILNNLHKKYLDNNILPGVIFHEKSYPSTQLINTLISCFKEQFEVAENSSREKLVFQQRCLLNLEKTIIKIALVNNLYYYPKHHPEIINPTFLIPQLKDFKMEIEDALESKESTTMLGVSRSKSGNVPRVGESVFFRRSPSDELLADNSNSHKENKPRFSQMFERIHSSNNKRKGSEHAKHSRRGDSDTLFSKPENKAPHTSRLKPEKSKSLTEGLLQTNSPRRSTPSGIFTAPAKKKERTEKSKLTNQITSESPFRNK